MAFRYLNPVQQQHVSSFVPMPLEFLERQMSAKQGRYDQAQTLMAGAEDAFGGAEVNQADIAKKNEIINKYFGDVDEVVQSEYGADWGNALNVVKRRIAGIGKDSSFAAFQKNVEGKAKYDEAVARFTQSGQDFDEVNPNIRNEPTFDPETGQAREIDYMSNIKSIEDIEEIATKGVINRLTRSVGDIALKAHQGMPGVLSYGTIQGVAQKNIPGRIGQADIETIKNAAPNWVTKYDMTDEKIYEYLVNKAMSEVPYGVQSRYMNAPTSTTDSDEPRMVRGKIALPQGLFGDVALEKFRGLRPEGSTTTSVAPTGRVGAIKSFVDMLRKDYSSGEVPYRRSEEEVLRMKEKYGDDYVKVWEEADRNLYQTFADVEFYAFSKEVNAIQDNKEAIMVAGGSAIVPVMGMKSSLVDGKADYESFVGKLNEKDLKEFHQNLRLIGVDKSNSLSSEGDIWSSRVDGKSISFITTDKQDVAGTLDFRLHNQLLDPVIRGKEETEPISVPGLQGITIYKKFEIVDKKYVDTEYVLTDNEGNTTSMSPLGFKQFLQEEQEYARR